MPVKPVDIMYWSRSMVPIWVRAHVGVNRHRAMGLGPRPLAAKLRLARAHGLYGPGPYCFMKSIFLNGIV